MKFLLLKEKKSHERIIISLMCYTFLKSAQRGESYIKDIHNTLKKLKSISTRVIYLTLKLSARYNLKIIQAYAPTSAADEEEIEAFYGNLNEALRLCPAHYTLITGDLNAKLGQRQEESGNALGKYGYGERMKGGVDSLISYMNMTFIL